MTVQFKAQWQQYEANGVYTLAPSEETRLIGLGIAVDYTPQPTSALALARRNALTGASLGVFDGATNQAVGGGGSGVVALASPTFQNFNLSNTRNLRASLAAARAKSARSRWLFVGDSFPAGFGSNGSANGNARAKSFPVQMASALRSLGYNVNDNYVCGVGFNGNNSGTLVNEYDPRMVFAGGATVIGSPFDAFGGFLLQLATPGTSTINITFGASFDRLDVLYPVNGPQGSLTIAADGGAVQQTINTAGSAAYGYGNLTVNGNAVVNLGATTAFTAFSMLGVRSNAAPGIELVNASVGGITLQTLAQDTGVTNKSWATRAAIPLVLESGIRNVLWLNGWFNDRANGRTIAQTQADLTTLITAGLARGDVIYVGYTPLNPASIPEADFNAWQDGMISAALAAGAAVIDPRSYRESYATSNSLGLMFDSLHNGGAGQADVARLCMTAINA